MYIIYLTLRINFLILLVHTQTIYEMKKKVKKKKKKRFMLFHQAFSLEPVVALIACVLHHDVFFLPMTIPCLRPFHFVLYLYYHVLQHVHAPNPVDYLLDTISNKTKNKHNRWKNTSFHDNHAKNGLTRHCSMSEIEYSSQTNIYLYRSEMNLMLHK